MPTPWWRRFFGAFGLTSSFKKQPLVRKRLHLETLEDRLAPADILWSGAVNSNWSNGGNWIGGTAPGASDVAVFDNTQAGGTNANSTVDAAFAGSVLGIDIPHYNGTITDSLATLDLGADGYSHAGVGTFTVSGALTIHVAGDWTKTGGTFNAGTGTVDFTAAGTRTLRSGNSAFNNIIHSGAGTLQLVNNDLTTDGRFTNSAGITDINGKDLTVNDFRLTGGSVDDSGNGTITSTNDYDVQAGAIGAVLKGTGVGLIKSTAATVTLSADNLYTGATTVNAGTLLVNDPGSLATGSAVTVNNNATLGGDGNAKGSVQLNNTAHLAPGTSPGVLHSGSVTFTSNANFDVQINGANAATPDFDQLIVTGSATLAGASLNLSGAYLPLVGDSFLILKTSTGVSGTFAGLPQGATVFFNGQPLKIDYTAGGNKDVVLTYNTAPVIDGTAAAENINVALSGLNVVVMINAVTVMNTPLASLTSLTINGNGGNDTLTVDTSAGNPIPVGGLTFNGGAAGDDRLAVKGSGIQNAVYTPDASTTGKGTVVVDGKTINFTGLEPVDIFGMLTATLKTPLTGANDTLTVTNGFNLTTAPGAIGTVPALVVSGTTGDSAFGTGNGTAIESVAFFNNAAVVINTTATDGADKITIASANNAHANTDLTVITGVGADDLIVSGAVSVAGTFTATTPKVDLNNDITAATITGAATTVNVNNTTAQIQDGIDVANVAGATVNIAAGTFAENVLVNKAVTLKGAGVTTIIDPSAAGDAILVTAGGATIRDLRLTGTTGAGSDGLQADSLPSLTLINVKADNNARDGFSLTKIASLATLSNLIAADNVGDGFAGNSLNLAGTVTFSGGSFTGNGGDGIHLGGSNNIVTSAVTASGNNAGIFLSDVATFSDTGSAFTSNTGNGIQIEDIPGLVSLTGTTLSDNGGDGLNATDTANDLDTFAIGSLTLSGVTIKDTAVANTQQHGVFVGDIGGLVTFNDSGATSNTINSNTAGGVVLGNILGAVTITSTHGATYSSNTGGDGINIASLTGVLTVSGIAVSKNAGDGLDIGAGGTTASIGGTFSENTAGSGINLNSAGGAFIGPVTLTSVTADGNSGEGLDAVLPLAANVITGSHFDGNARGMLLTTGTLSVTNSTFSNNTIASDGAGIDVVGGTLTLTSVTIAGNTASGGAQGGGINFVGGTGHTILNSTLNNNSASAGAGINLASTFADAVTVTNSTISTNTGAGIRVVAGTLTLNFDTIAFNTGAGLNNAAAAANVVAQDSLFASNGGNDLTGDFTSNGNNLFENPAGITSGLVATDVINQLARLAPLSTAYGGTTATHALLPGSAALDNGAMILGIATDQRGSPRPANTFFDIGAFESKGFMVERISVPDGAGTTETPAGDTAFRGLIDKPFVGADGSTPLQFAVKVTANDPGLTDLTSGVLTFLPPAGAVASATPALAQPVALTSIGGVFQVKTTLTANNIPSAPATNYVVFATVETNPATFAVGGPNNTDWKLFNQKVTTLFYNIATGNATPAQPQNTQSGEVTLFKSGNGTTSSAFTVTLLDQDLVPHKVNYTGEPVTLVPATTGIITDVTGNGVGPIVITSPAHGLVTGQVIEISGVLGNIAANGVFTVTVIGPNRFKLVGTVGSGDYTGGGTYTHGIITATSGVSATPVVVTSPKHGLTTGQQVTISGVLGNTNANGTFTVTVINANQFRLDGTHGNGAYAGGGVVDQGFIDAITNPVTLTSGGTARTTTVNGVAHFADLQIFRSNYDSPYVLKALYVNPAPDGTPVASVTNTFRVLPHQFVVTGGNFAGAFQTAFNITVALSSRGQIRLVNFVSGQNGLGTNQMRVQAFDFFSPGVVTKASHYNGPVFLTFSVNAKSIGPNVNVLANMPAQFAMTKGVLFLPNITTTAAVPADGFTVAAEFGLTAVPTPNTPFLMDPAGFVMVNAGEPPDVFTGRFTRLNLGRLRRR